jgi:cyclic pyranopterin phosphate synthase
VAESRRTEDGEARPGGLTHIDDLGLAHMVDVTAKPLTRRIATARCSVVTEADAGQVLRAASDGLDVVEAARVAGVQAAKQTAALIPLCHPIALHAIGVKVEVGAHRIDISATAEIVERTGVEMEALTACAVAALALLPVLLAADPGASVEDLTLWHKSGGRSGVWERRGPKSEMQHGMEGAES